MRRCFCFRRGAALALIAASAAAGCRGYAWDWGFPPGVKTVYVHTFKNETFRRELEFALTRAIVEEVNSKSPLRIVPEGEADSVLTGWIESVVENPQVETRLDAVRESDVRITIRLVWKNRRTGELLLDESRVVHTEQFLVPLGDTVGTATAEALREIAEKVLQRMQVVSPAFSTFPKRGTGVPDESAPSSLPPVTAGIGETPE